MDNMKLPLADKHKWFASNPYYLSIQTVNDRKKEKDEKKNKQTNFPEEKFSFS